MPEPAAAIYGLSAATTIRRLSPEENHNPNHYHSQYYVLSSNGHTVYVVSKLLNWNGTDWNGTEGWECSCVGWTRHVPRRDCRHILKAREFEATQDNTRRVQRRTELEQAGEVAVRVRRTRSTGLVASPPARTRAELVEEAVREHFSAGGLTAFSTTYYICRDCGWAGTNPDASRHETENSHHEWIDCGNLESALRAISENRQLLNYGQQVVAVLDDLGGRRETSPADPQPRAEAANTCRHERRARMFIDLNWERCGVCQVVVRAGS